MSMMTILVLGLPFLLASQDRFLNPVQINHETGLLSDSVHIITKGSRGFIWIGTDQGLCRFDGSIIQPFRAPAGQPDLVNGNRVYDVVEDPATGHLWIGTFAGLTVWDPAIGTCLVFQADQEHADSLPDNTVRDIYRDRAGVFWLSSWTQGLVRYRPEAKAFQRYRFEPPAGGYDPQAVNASRINSITDIAQDVRHDSILWLATMAGLLRFNQVSGAYRLYFHNLPDPNLAYLGNSLTTLYTHADGRLYLGSFAMASVFDPATERFHTIGATRGKVAGNIPFDMVMAIVPHTDGGLWVSYRDGVVHYAPNAGRVTWQWENDYQRGYYYGAWLVDEAGRVWNGTERDGVFLFDPLRQQTRQYPFAIERQNLAYAPQAVRESPDGRRLYVAVEDGEGLYILDRRSEQWTLVRPPAPAGGFQCVDLGWSAEGRLLVLTSEGLFRLSADERRLDPLPLPLGDQTHRFRRLLRDRRGNLWLTSRREGVYRIAPGGRVDHYREALNDEGSTNQFIWVEHIFEDSRGWIWIRLARSFCIYQPEHDTFLRFPYLAGRSANTFRYLRNFAEDRYGRVWIASDEEGIGMVDPARPGQGIIRKFTQADGLASNRVSSIGADARGDIWIITAAGLSKLDAQSLAFQRFGDGYGIPPRGAVLSTLSSGEMALAYSKGGLSIFHPDSLRTNAEMPRPYLTSFRVFDREVAGTEQLFHRDELRLSYRQNFFSFEFSAIGYTNAQRNVFAYQLQGFDENWNFAGTRRYAAYTNVPGGDYVLRLRVANNEGIWNETPYTLRIHISTPWWQTGLFRAGLVVLLGGAGWSAYRIRVGQIRREERLRAEFEKRLADVEMNALRAQMNPHFIFNCLNSIDYYILKNETEKASDYLNRFSRLIRLILQNSSANTVNLRDELEALKLYMEMESLRFDDKFDYEVRVEKGLELENIEIPPMLLQPYVENAIWHGLMHKEGHGKVELTLSRENGVLRCVIEDDGIGRERAQAMKSKTSVRRKSMGMRITHDRINLINKLYDSRTSVRVIDLKDEDGRPRGTRVELEIPT